MSMTRILVRLPSDVRNWLKSQAEANSSTMTAEVVRSIRQRMDDALPAHEATKIA